MKYQHIIPLIILLSAFAIADLQIIEVPVQTNLNAETQRLNINIAGGSNQIDISTKENFTQTYTLQIAKNITCTNIQGVSENDFTKFYTRFDQFVTVYNDTWQTHATNYIDTKAKNAELAVQLDECQKTINTTGTNETQYMYQLAQNAMQEATQLRNKPCYEAEYNACKEDRDKSKNNIYLAGLICLGLGGLIGYTIAKKKTAQDETEEYRE